MARRTRLDAELVRRGLARSREQAAELIAAGRVEVRGTAAAKPAAMVDPADPVRVRDDGSPTYVSRGGHKLAGALAGFGLTVTGRRCLDAGASTGGFTDVLLRAGAAEVVAVDVGYGQLAWSLRTDRRVRVLDRCNVRTLTADVIGGPADLVVADLSFISLRLVLPALAGCLTPDGGFMLGYAVTCKGDSTTEDNDRREHTERAATCGSALVGLGAHWPARVSFPCVVTFTRISPRLCDTDNLAGACKSVRDQLAAELGITDSPTDPRARWEYKQELGTYPAVRVRIESAEIGEGAA